MTVIYRIYLLFYIVNTYITLSAFIFYLIKNVHTVSTCMLSFHVYSIIRSSWLSSARKTIKTQVHVKGHLQIKGLGKG